MAGTLVSSSHNPRFREALALRDARERRRSRRILIDGAREIRRAVESGVNVIEAFVNRDRLEQAGPEARRALVVVESARASIVEVTPELLDRLAYGDRDQGLVVVAEMPDAVLANLELPPSPLVGVVESVEKPGNLGAILRTADGAGLDALLVANPRTDPWNPNAIRASLGTVFSVPLAVADADEVLDWVRARGLRILAARVDADRDYFDADLTGPLCIALGNEADGLSRTWGAPDIAAVRIPMLGVADSLNVSASAAILFYEARRQRGLAAIVGD